MAESFDPYRRWLGIPSGERPPNHYVLLGLSAYEDDAETIANAADRQMAYVRTQQTGPHAAATQQLLNELAAARLCLLNSTQKARYDADLRAKHTPTAPAPIPVHRPLAVTQDETQIAPRDLVRPAPPIAVSAPALRGSVPRNSKNKLPGWLVPAAGGLVAGALLMGLVMSLGGNERTKTLPGEATAAPHADGRLASEQEAKKAARAKDKASAMPDVNPIFKSIERLNGAGVVAEKIVLWNTHSGGYRDRGTLECNVRLMLGGREVWSQVGMTMPWAADDDRSLTVALPTERFDVVRIEITKWHNLGGGLAEVEVLSADGHNLARGCPAFASGVFSHRFAAEHVTDGITTSAEADSGYWLLPDKTVGWIEVDLSLPRPPDLAGVTAEKLVVWNQHNGPHNNSGTQSFDVTLFRGKRNVWHKEHVELPWAPGEDTYTAVKLPATPFDRVRIDVRPQEGKWAGLSEVQVLRGSQNLALNCPATANGVFDRRRCEIRVTDGIVRSDAENVGYWLLPQQSPGWVEIDLACLDAKYGAACRQLGLARALFDGDWRRGLLWLARGDQQALRRLAQADRQELRDTSEQVAVADAWWNWAQQADGKVRQRLLARSLWRYRQALSKLHEFRKTEVQARLDEALPGLPERDALYFMPESELKAGDPFFREMPVVVRGELSPYGLFLHAVSNDSSHAAFHLGKRYRRFRGAAAINDSAWNRTATPLTFRIVGDGRELWKSSPLKETGSSEAFDLDVSATEKLELFVDCSGDYGWGHAAWVEPWFEH